MSSVLRQWSGDPPLEMSDTWVPRTSTVQEIVRRLLRDRVIHVRGTPGCGKTILIALIHNELARAHREIGVKSCDWIDIATETESKILDLMGETHRNGLLTAQKKCLLIDDGQLSYSNDFLWNKLIKNISQGSRGLLILIATAYGSAGSSPATLQFSVPPVIPRRDRISLRPSYDDSGPGAGLYLEAKEVQELVLKEMKQLAHKVPFAEEAVTWLARITSGHVGALSGIIRIMIALKVGKGLREIDLNTLKAVITDQKDKLIRRLKDHERFGRGLPEIEELHNSDLNKILREVVINGQTRKLNKHASIVCYERGLLHLDEEEDGTGQVLVFASPLHQWFFTTIIASPSSPVDISKFLDPLLFCIVVLKKFRPRQLSGPERRPGSQNKITHEDKYQKEFYRCAAEVLRGQCYVSPEFGIRDRKGGGSIDFFLPGFKWGIELITEGGRWSEHSKSFKDGGAYLPWFKDKIVEKYILLDCRRREVTKAQPEIQHLYHAVFSGDFTSVQI